MLRTLLVFFLTRNVIRYLCRTVCLVVDLSNRMKVFILSTLLLLQCNFQTNQSRESVPVFFNDKQDIIESLFKTNPYPIINANKNIHSEIRCIPYVGILTLQNVSPETWNYRDCLIIRSPPNRLCSLCWALNGIKNYSRDSCTRFRF